MMDEIASHIMDIVANSVSAKAKDIVVTITKDTKKALLTLRIKDDGIGMDEDMARKVQDPFFSTKIGKKVGLGIPLLKGTAETTEGSFHLSSSVGKGTEILATFSLNHPDLPPLGNLKDTVFVIVLGNPETDFRFQIISDGEEFVLDTKEIKALLDGIPINHPEVIAFLSKYLDENM
jgi:anti-sigma regulatory factor (Ser/Thr protein kinase)